jgi:hypothetical protein
MLSINFSICSEALKIQKNNKIILSKASPVQHSSFLDTQEVVGLAMEAGRALNSKIQLSGTKAGLKTQSAEVSKLLTLNNEKKQDFGPKARKFVVLSRRNNDEKNAAAQNLRNESSKGRFAQVEPETPVRVEAKEENAKRAENKALEKSEVKKGKCEQVDGREIENCTDNETESRPHGHNFFGRESAEKRTEEKVEETKEKKAEADRPRWGRKETVEKTEKVEKTDKEALPFFHGNKGKGKHWDDEDDRRVSATTEETKKKSATNEEQSSEVHHHHHSQEQKSNEEESRKAAKSIEEKEQIHPSVAATHHTTTGTSTSGASTHRTTSNDARKETTTADVATA